MSLGSLNALCMFGCIRSPHKEMRVIGFTHLITTGGRPHTPGAFCWVTGAPPHTNGISHCSIQFHPHTFPNAETQKKMRETRKNKYMKKFSLPSFVPHKQTNNATKEERRCRCNWNRRRAHFLHYNHSPERHHEYHIVCAARCLSAASDCTCVERPQIWANSRTRARRRRCCRQNACHAAEYITVK
jgi:hypothetical protein